MTIEKKIKVEITLFLDEDADLKETIKDISRDAVIYSFDHEAIVGSVITKCSDGTSYEDVILQQQEQIERLNNMLIKAMSHGGNILADCTIDESELLDRIAPPF